MEKVVQSTGRRLGLKRHRDTDLKTARLGVGGREKRRVLLRFTLHSNLKRKGSAPFFRWEH